MLMKMKEVVNKVDRMGRHYHATVVDNDDPKQLGRVKAIIIDLFVDDDPEKLPWIFPERDSFQGGSEDSGTFDCPMLGSVILVKFPTKDIYYPVYFGYPLNELTKQKLFLENYPFSYGKLDTSGNFYRVDMVAGDAWYKHSAKKLIDGKPDPEGEDLDGSFWHIDKEGNLNINIKKNVIFNFDADVDIRILGKLTVSILKEALWSVFGSFFRMHSKGKMQVQAKEELEMAAGSSMSITSVGNGVVHGGGNLDMKAGSVVDSSGGSGVPVAPPDGVEAKKNDVTPPQ